MISEDEYLERIVAGIHFVTSDNAEISWNEKINGRQFDVVVRFKLGTLSYLVLIEVKNRSRKASASDLEAFALKARDHLASKSVFVTTAGFQSGALDVAKRHGVDLFTVSFADKPQLAKQGSWITLRKTEDTAPPYIEVGEAQTVNQIEKITLLYFGGQAVTFPDEPSQMMYYAAKSKLSDGRTLHDVLQAVFIPHLELTKSYSGKFDFRPPLELQPPDELFYRAGLLSGITYEATARLGRPIKGNAQIEPTAFSSPVVYTDVIAGQTTEFNLSTLPLGDASATPDRYYLLLNPLRYFYCASIDRTKITWHLIESFQNATLVRGTFTQDLKYSRFYVPVTDIQTLKRLRVRLDLYNALRSK
ncbi:restriction endonuclease [Bradyrhizobium sp. 930_D9_N1_4]|uniref:restriction endonuclease n=1 Tax=Bradyrhizobium sp. 930_D9_N1_4 TaxID=3240374 RepID=UPI003F8B8A15